MMKSIKEINEELTKILNENEDTVWDALKFARYTSDMSRCFDFFFGTHSSFHITAHYTETVEEKGTYLAVNKNNFALFVDNKKIYDFSNYEKCPELKICDKEGYEIYKLSEYPRTLSKLDKDALKIDITDVIEPYGSNTRACKDYMKKYGINPDISYVPKKDIMAASKPSLHYDYENQRFVCIVGNHGKGFYNIPIEKFNELCVPETDIDRNRSLFIAGQD